MGAYTGLFADHVFPDNRGGTAVRETKHVTEFRKKMSTLSRITLCLGVLAGTLLVAGLPAEASTIDVDLSGTFLADNDVFVVDFTLDNDGFVSFFTSSWNSPNSGLGFDTALFVWDSTGNWLGFPAGYSDDVGAPGSEDSNGVTYAYGANDAFINSFFFGAGEYTLTLVQTGNLPVNFPAGTNLSDGFTQAAQPNYTRDILGYGPNDFFNGAGGGDPRNGDWALHLLGISSYSIPGGAPIPEPASLTLLALGAGLCGLRARCQVNRPT